MTHWLVTPWLVDPLCHKTKWFFGGQQQWDFYVDYVELLSVSTTVLHSPLPWAGQLGTIQSLNSSANDIIFLSVNMVEPVFIFLTKQSYFVHADNRNKLRCNFNQSSLLDVADAMVKTGMVQAGYKTLNIDDCWPLKLRNPNTVSAVKSSIFTWLRSSIELMLEHMFILLPSDRVKSYPTQQDFRMVWHPFLQNSQNGGLALVSTLHTDIWLAKSSPDHWVTKSKTRHNMLRMFLLVFWLNIGSFFWPVALETAAFPDVNVCCWIVYALFHLLSFL